MNWSAIDVSIFGTLFERGLDPAKRSQLGAHYTDPATILRIVEPVLQRPLLQIWEETAAAVGKHMAKSIRRGDRHHKAAQAMFIAWLERLDAYRVLDPACGSGNFLYLGLKALKDIEHRSHLEGATLGLDRQQDLVTGPHNVLGIELNEYAAELARMTVWIGELQWRIAHGYDFKTNPVLEPLDHIECRDALLATEPATGKTVEAQWPKASVVIGNPPFLGDKKMRAELGDDYTNTLRKTYEGRVPGGADLVCYWFEKARKAIETNGLGAAGLVATNSIRGGRNRAVLDAITRTTRIYEAWSDEEWVNEGAAVRVSLVAFGHADQEAMLDGAAVPSIHSDLAGSAGAEHSIDLTRALDLPQNKGAAFVGIQKTGPFEIPGDLARAWLRIPNLHGQPNSAAVRPWFNGLDVTRRNRDMWIVDFGAEMDLNEASLFEAPFSYVTEHVKPTRIGKREARTNERYWLFQWSRPVMRAAIAGLPRFIVTGEVAKHRNFAYLPATTIADKNLSVVARADDTTFGVLHSRFHELRSLRMGTSLEDRPRYTPTTCFETFPFPQGLTPADTAHQQTEELPDGASIPAGASTGSVRTAAISIAQAAKRLNDLREAWLNPPEWTQRVPEVVPLGMDKSPYPDRIVAKPGHEKELADRTLTKLYNQRPSWLDAAHKALDAAVASAYGWTDYTPELPDEEVLRRLLALNRERSGG